MAEAESPSLRNVRILVAEDNVRLAKLYVAFLESFGAIPIGPLATNRDALASLDHERPDIGLLDVSLKDGSVFPLAEQFRSRSVPFVFATGYDDDTLIPEDFRGSPRLVKPFDQDELREKILGVLKAGGRSGA